MKNFASTCPTWLPGVITEFKGDLSFHVEMKDGRIVRRHIDHIRHCTCTTENTSSENEIEDLLPPTTGDTTGPSSDSSTDEPIALSTVPHRSTRARNPPDRFM